LGMYLYRLGDHRATAKSGLHSLVPHPYCIVYRDRVERQGRARRVADTPLHLERQCSQVVVAGLGLRPGVCDTDYRALEIFVGQAYRPQHRPLGGPLHPRGDVLAMLFSRIRVVARFALSCSPSSLVINGWTSLQLARRSSDLNLNGVLGGDIGGAI